MEVFGWNVVGDVYVLWWADLGSGNPMILLLL